MTIFKNIFGKVEEGTSRVWYVGITQMIISSNSVISYHIGNEILTNRFIYQTTRPYEYVLFKFSESTGIFIVKAIFIALVLCTILYNDINFSQLSYVKVLLSTGMIFIGCCIFNLLLVGIGLTSFWTREVRGLTYVNMTACFSFGGLIMPIEYYSPTFQKIAYLTPYPWILSWPASFVSGNSIFNLKSLIYPLVWLMIILIVNLMIYQLINNTLRKN